MSEYDDTGPAVPPLRDDCFALPAGVHWMPVEETLALLRARLAPVTGEEEVALDAADGRVLAGPVAARRSNPPAANSAVDGYGFAWHDGMVGPQSLPLAEGRAAAGAPYGRRLERGAALRVLTGAVLPEGMDTVLLEEDVWVEDGRVVFDGLPQRGANTRRAGEDIEIGAPALGAGRLVRPEDIALLAATGTARLTVRRRLRVGVLSTGDELAAPGETTDPARTYDANRPMLLAILARWGYVPVDLGHVPDRRDALRDAFDAARARCDVLLSSGGASAGDEDHVSAILRAEAHLTAWRIAVKPGRPLALAMWRGMPVFGLPGNPVAAFTCTLVFARPALAQLAGGNWSVPAGFTVPAAFEKTKKAGRREFLRARLTGEGHAEVFASEGSGRISGLGWAGGFVELAEPAGTVAPGDPVRFVPYGSFGL
ncbi:molybdopterin-binding protein [Profundibacterium mesophilum]|uniref:Molybdopterin molybdenumtransferase n=1 Tax=Profundibacterium mesophilum KAUST100406-0324 TaxID=1037889 RepID=A0A921NZK5_9RHOB|nr:molybdopterin-binding protein [Profundibacterium mesophilum]KAF0676433.1 Molybdopterin biosynthesis protein [Profundibacterium mesophilum KAUST100406-0324]